MAVKKAKAVTGYEIKVVGNTEFCGVGAGGVQFAYGKAQITGGRMVDWFREHEGYEVTEIVTEVDEAPDAPAE
nr:MAG TPA_asm: hypothetical protein [Caudoviricetes sp.]